MAVRDELEAGREAFGHLIRVWHERNGWSQRLLPALAELLELGRVHNSQLSNLRNRKLASPGPELFVALGRLNQLLARACGPTGIDASLRQRLADQPELLVALETSALPLLGDNGKPLGPSQLFEVFVGERQPPSAFDLRISPEEAAGLSAALAELLTAGRPWRHCREQLLAATGPLNLQLAWLFHDAIPVRWARLYGAQASEAARCHATYMAALAGYERVFCNSHKIGRAHV